VGRSQKEDAEDSPATDVIPIADARPVRETVTPDDRNFLLAMATRLCRPPLEPGDLVQDVLERALRHHDKIPSDDPRPWMIRVMRNLFIDRLRKQSRTPRQDDIDEVPVAQPVVESLPWWQSLDADDIRKKLPELPAEQRAAFELFAFEGLSYDQIAARLKISKNTVGTRVLRARRKLRTMFGGPGE
jgi:RNA polymerase sigma-70 factor (ECF subfamily)